MVKRFAIVFVWSLFFLQSAFAETQKLAVLEFRGGVDQAYLLNLSDQTRAAAVQSLSKEEYLIFTRENMMQILDDMGKGTSFLDERDIEIGRSIGADILVTGDVLSVNSVYVLNLKLYETKTGRLLATQEVQNEDLLKLKEETFLKSKDLFEQGLGSSKKMTFPLLKQKTRFFVDMSGGMGFGGWTETYLGGTGYYEDLSIPVDGYDVGGVSSGTASLFGGAFGIAFGRIDMSLYGGIVNGTGSGSYVWELQDLSRNVLETGEEKLDNIQVRSYILEPKLRLYFWPNQNVTPYLLTSRYWQHRTGFSWEEEGLDIPESNRLGVSFGGGLRYSNPKKEALNVFLEIPWTYVHRVEGLMDCHYEDSGDNCHLFEPKFLESNFLFFEKDKPWATGVYTVTRIQLGLSFHFK